MNFYQNLTIKAREALGKAIRDFISPEEIVPDSHLDDLAMEYVMEHDEEIRDGLRDMLDLESLFDDQIDEAIGDAYERY